RVQSGTRIIDLASVLRFRSSLWSVRQTRANFGIGTLAGALKLAAGILVALAFGANAAPGAPETLRFAIMRNRDQIGTHTVEINRGPKETSVNMSTDLAVKVMFITAYHLQYTTSEKWVGGKLVALNSQSDDNGTKYKVSATLKPNGL